MVTSEHRRELAGMGLTALSVFLLLALVPVGIFGARGPAWFPSGNVLGPVGLRYEEAALRAVGIGAVLIPVLAALAGLVVGRWLPRERALRWGTLAAGLFLLAPTFLALLPVGPSWSGWLGDRAAAPLVAGLGHFGSGLLLVVLFVLLSMATLGWNPLVAPAAGAAGVGRFGRRAWGHSVHGVGGLFGSLRQWVGEAWFERESPAPAAVDPGGAYEEVEATAPPPHGGPSPTPPPDSRRGADGRRPGPALLPDPRDPRELEGGEMPPIDLLSTPVRAHRGDTERELDQLGQVLVDKLRTFNVESEIAGRTTGPVVTQFEVVPAPGVKVNRIANLDADLALAMRARTIRIVAPIPGKGAVGVEIPNPSPQMVQLREILESGEFRRSRAELPLALGKDLHGASYVADLAKMPHALIAGATGSGKSVCLNTIITSLVYRHTPETLRLLLIDPKMVELSTYADLPHLRHPVVTDPKDAAGVLKWAVLEMERRYELLSRNGVRSIGEFNRRLKKGKTMRRAEAEGEEGDPDRWIYDGGVLPNVVLIVDELADLMMSVQGEIEKPLTLLAQKARAIGIHLIVATQRPSVNVITGLIKANFPCRIAFRVASKTDSRTILDQNGADALLGNGDMLFLPPGQSTPVRMQGAFISTEDTESLMDWFRDVRDRRMEEDAPGAAAAAADEEDILEVVRTLEAEEAGSGDDPFDGEWDEYFREAAEVCITNDQGSTSLLQRKLRIGYGRAARIVDQLHDAGVVGPPDGSKPREVLMTLEQLDRMMSG